jgi:hypothetical protein
MKLENSVDLVVRRSVVSSVLNPIYKIEHVAVTSSVWVIINTRIDEVVSRVVKGRVHDVIWLDIKLKFYTLKLLE